MSQYMPSGNQQNHNNGRPQYGHSSQQNQRNQYNQYVQANRQGQDPRPTRPASSGQRPQSSQNGAPRRRPAKKKGPSLGLIALILIIAGIVIIFCASILTRISNGDANETTGADETTAPVETTEPNTTEPETTEPPVTEPPIPEIDFTADLSEYEKYFDPENREEYSFLVNTSHPIDETYKPTDLIEVVDTRKDGRATQYLKEYASKSLEAMLIEARANGCVGISATSAYRSFEYQTTLFNNEVSRHSTNLSYEDAYKKAATFVAIPGTSEHQTGLCVDIHNIPTGASVLFADTPEGAWLAENCWKFGFILRYPKDKTEITGISFEPWHFRFVGRYTAYQIHSQGICLEEYHEQLNANNQPGADA